MAIVPLKQLIGRPPEHGRLRLGEKTLSRNGKQIPTAIDRWRFTSPDRNAIEALASLHGGRVERWDEPQANPRNQWQVTTEANVIDVWLPQNCLTCTYECWTREGLQRRCDGEVCTNHTALGRVESPCVCIAEGLKKNDRRDPACKPYTRVNVIIPDIPFGGVWRLEVKGETFMQEAPGMVALIEQIHQRSGMARAKLMLTSRQAHLDDGQLAQYIVPQFFVPQTAAEMLDGMSMVGVGSGQPAMAALSPAPAEEAELLDPVWHDGEDDDVVDAEILPFPTRREQPPEPEGWDDANRPRNIAVRRNPDPNGPKWIRK